MNKPVRKDIIRFTKVVRIIFEVSDDDISCEGCFEQVDRYVDMLRAGIDPGEVLPKVKAHLGICGGCEEEFKALISILEDHLNDSPSGSDVTSDG